MPTDEERKAVAVRLEMYGNLEFDGGYPWRHLTEAVYGDTKRHDYNELFFILADLIEPEERTCEMYRDEEGTWHCKSCEDGADKITGSDGELDNWCDSWHPNFCPNCGAKVVTRWIVK